MKRVYVVLKSYWSGCCDECNDLVTDVIGVFTDKTRAHRLKGDRGDTIEVIESYITEGPIPQ